MPFFEVYQCDGLAVDKIFTYPAAKHYKVQDGGVIFLLTEQQRQGWTLKGDIKILFRHAGFSNETFCRIMFNTSFIQNGNYIKAGKMELSPEDIRKDKGKVLPNDFKVYIFFDDFCSVCDPLNTEMKDLCDTCKLELGDHLLNEWNSVHSIISRHSYPKKAEAEKLLPHVDPELLASTLKTKLKFDSNYYRVWNESVIKEQIEKNILNGDSTAISRRES